MSESIKSQAEILSKLGIETLNPMQKEALLAIGSHSDIVLLSPTGTGHFEIDDDWGISPGQNITLP